MAHTKNAVCFDPTSGLVIMVVVPDDDKQLDDPSYNPNGMVQLRVDEQGLTEPGQIIAAAQALTDVRLTQL